MSIAPLNQSVPIQLNGLSSGFSNFTLDLYQQCIQTESDNVVFAPLSILSVLTLLSQAANGPTFDQIKKGLHLSDDKQANANQFSEYQNSFKKSVGNTTLSVVNQIYVHQNYSLNKSFQEVATKNFSAGIESVDFATNNTAVAEKINKFIENHTNNKIKNFIKPKSINNEARIILVNANYFKGDWLYKFDEKLTKTGDFYISETKTVPVEFMHVKNNFRSREFDDLDANSIELKYANSNLSFVLVLPHKREGLSKLEDKLNNYNLTKLAGDFGQGLSGYEVILPKFKVEFEIELSDPLKNLGMSEMFKKEADLKGLLEPNATGTEQFSVSEVVHKAFIEINEEGSEATSATSLKVEVTASYSIDSRPVIPRIKVDHPFLFYIWDTQTQTAIFGGRVTKPSSLSDTSKSKQADDKSCVFFGLIC